MSLVLALILTTLGVALLREPLRRVPVVFYLLSIGVVVAGVYLILNPSPNMFLRDFATVLQRGYVAFSLFALVMFIGFIPRSSKNGRRFIAIRSELSIIASILICAHFIPYLVNYVSMLPFFTSLKWGVMFSLILSFALMLLLIPLAITSFKVVRNKMKPETWKRLQRFSYLFFGLVYFHLLGYLLAPLQEGSVEAVISVIVYTLIFVSYFVLRIRKDLAERSQNRERSRSNNISDISETKDLI